MTEVKKIPDGYPHVSPYLVVQGGAAAIEFYVAVFGAEERMRMPAQAGSIGHAELTIGDSLLMLADEFPGASALAPPSVGGSPVMISIYVEDVDAVVAAAVERGAEVLQPVQDKFYGDRSGTLRDPFGHLWSVATHVEDLTPEELAKRSADAKGM